jgi:hypothetical protein
MTELEQSLRVRTRGRDIKYKRSENKFLGWVNKEKMERKEKERKR